MAAKTPSQRCNPVSWGSFTHAYSRRSSHMTDRRWITYTIGSIAAFTLCAFLLLYLGDPYGLFQNPAGRKLFACLADREAKYLLSERYVPANFNGLIIGPSTGLNWEPPAIPHVRIYNESVVGANASEEKRIIDRALQNGSLCTWVSLA